MTRPMTRRTSSRVAPRRSVPLVGAVGALALALTACGGGAGTSTEDDAEDSASTFGSGPLDAYFERIYGGSDEDVWQDQQREVEELVAECMAEQGFEYVPVDYASMSQPAVEDPEVEWGTREFAEQYGYGMSTWPGMEEEPSPEEAGWEDPNQAYVEAMSETERDAYYVALHGEMSGPEPGEEEEWEYDWTQAGCQGSSQQAIQEKYGLAGEEMTALQEEMELLWTQIQADERLTALTTQWSDCMADAGYTGLAAMEDAQNALMEEQNAIYDEVYGSGEAVEESEWEKLEEEVQKRTAELTEKEIATAVADFDCREDIGFEKVQVEVTNEYQQTFVDTHRDELEAWVESVEAARS